MGFADQVAQGGVDFFALARTAVEITVEMVGELIVETTPIGKPEEWKRKPPADYKPGALKSNWRLTIDDLEDRFDPDRTSSYFVLHVDPMPANPFGHRFIFTNAAPYALPIEFEAWSNQAPSGITGPVSLEFSRIAAEAATQAKSRAGGAREL